MSRGIEIERDEAGRAVRLWFGRESADGVSVASASVATLRSGIPCDFCGAEIPPSRRRGSERRFCSEKCRRDSWEAKHPRLDFDRQDRPRVTAPATGEPYEAARVWLLGRLQVGPVSTLELRTPPWRASQNPPARILELRNRQHDIRTVRKRLTWYWLHVDGLPVGCVPEGE